MKTLRLNKHALDRFPYKDDEYMICAENIVLTQYENGDMFLTVHNPTGLSQRDEAFLQLCDAIDHPRHKEAP